MRQRSICLAAIVSSGSDVPLMRRTLPSRPFVAVHQAAELRDLSALVDSQIVEDEGPQCSLMTVSLHFLHLSIRPFRTPQLARRFKDTASAYGDRTVLFSLKRFSNKPGTGRGRAVVRRTDSDRGPYADDAGGDSIR